MNNLTMDELYKYVNENIDSFHEARLRTLENLNLSKLLIKKNPYLFRAKNITLASEFVEEMLNASLSSSEEEMFGVFLEDLAIFIAEKTLNGRKSSAPGIDLEFNNKDTHYLASIKSGPNWGNSSQQKKQAENFQEVVIHLRQSSRTMHVQTVLGICYGRVKSAFQKAGHLKVCGHDFWYLISEDENLYKELIEPLGYRAKEHNGAFLNKRNAIINLYTQEFIVTYCHSDGSTNWQKVVEVNSLNPQSTITWR